MRQKMKGSIEAKTLVDEGFTGNGCGNNAFNMILGILFQRWARVSFLPACIYHDAEHESELNNEEHRLEADKNFLLNLQSCCIEVSTPRYRKRAERLAHWFHWAVVINSKKVYYANKEKDKS